MVSSLGIAEPLIICCQQGDWHNQTKNTSLPSKDLGTFLKHLMNEAIRISTVCTKQELGSSLKRFQLYVSIQLYRWQQQVGIYLV